ncbi:hypothetical protein RQP50_06070 [Paenibacillus sp. chi10]|uniref:Uncharacterized protein n=1 Tax=Paenibacillus suaedae TaxID=3077233 RepID=A0AAJ2JWY1_9BACL|nr:hypothetical protein [Paenibacillus sp. chi10]MDT8975804.1 hypothetical protein [Paenibacillus sp. chi10]
MKKILFYSLGGSDVQDKQLKYDRTKSSDDQKRVFNGFSDFCEKWYSILESNTEETIANIEIPLLNNLLKHLADEQNKPDQIVLFYTEQKPQDTKDTFWAYRIIEYIVTKTDLLGYRIPVVKGIQVQGNPASLSEMMYLYNELLTENTLRNECGVSEADIALACFTAGTPAMSHHLLEAFSGLKYPKNRHYYDVRRDRVQKIQLADLLRYDDVFKLVENMLYNRQFSQALDIIRTMQFTFLQPVLKEIEDVVRAFHYWTLFDYKEAVKHWEQGMRAWNTEDEHEYTIGCELLTKLYLGSEKIKTKNEDWLDDKDIRLVVQDYYRKACYFWEREQWQDFSVSASSFYEWLLYMKFVQIMGIEFVRGNHSGKNWTRYLERKKEEVQSRFPDFEGISRSSDRMAFIDMIKANSSSSEIIGSWGAAMDKLYRKRNEAVHALATITDTIIKECVGENWPEDTGSMLQQDFHVEIREDSMKRLIQSFVKTMENRLMTHLQLQKQAAILHLVT